MSASITESERKEPRAETFLSHQCLHRIQTTVAHSTSKPATRLALLRVRLVEERDGMGWLHSCF